MAPIVDMIDNRVLADKQRVSAALLPAAEKAPAAANAVVTP